MCIYSYLLNPALSLPVEHRPVIRCSVLLPQYLQCLAALMNAC